jgi:hypothetical protein
VSCCRQSLPAERSRASFVERGIFALIVFLNGVAAAQSPPTYVDPEIAGALREISAGQIQSDIEKLVGFETRSTVSAQDPASIGSGRGIGAARQWIRSEFERYARDCAGCLEVKTDSFIQPVGERIPAATELTNVYAVLKGTSSEDSKRIVVVTGHYDSRNSNPTDGSGLAPGANDDASGTAVSLECARVLSKLKFPGTIIFLAVSGEEQGLYGSKHFAEVARTAGWQVQAVLNNDIVGGDRSPGQDPTRVRVFSESIAYQASEKDIGMIRALGGENDSPSRTLARYITASERLYQPGITPVMEFRLDRYLRGGDHISFNQKGFAAVRLTEFRENFNHQHQNLRSENGTEYGDLAKFVDFEYVANVARVNAAALAELGRAPGPPENVRLETRGLTNESTLHWEPPADGRAAAYRILWRSTSAPDWESLQSLAGNLTRATVPVSKDNVIFAVQALDEAGHRSLPVLPSPER